MVNSEGLILHKTGHERGRIIHDYEIFKNKHPTTPLQVANLLDLGYMGVQNDFPTVKSVCTAAFQIFAPEISFRFFFAIVCSVGPSMLLAIVYAMSCYDIILLGLGPVGLYIFYYLTQR